MNSIKRQVDVNRYDTDYYEKLYVSPDYSKEFDWNDFGDIYKDLANLIQLSPKDSVVDFGCGNGELSFCLYKKYNSKITGIDYSRDAISIAKNNLKKLKTINTRATLDFINNNNDQLPEFRAVDYVYFCDVLEHMYNDEIELVMEKIKKWNKNKGVRIIVHTDNDLFLRFIRPFIDLLAIFFGITSVKDIKRRNRWENERHVNLTNPVKLRKYIKKLGFRQMVLKYPKIDMSRVENQLGGLVKIPGLKYIAYKCVAILRSLSPSFYAVYEYKK